MNGNWEQLLGNDGAMFTLKRGWNEYRLEFTRTLDCALNNFVFISKDNVASEFLVDSFIFTETAEGTLESSELANMPAGNTVACSVVLEDNRYGVIGLHCHLSVRESRQTQRA